MTKYLQLEMGVKLLILLILIERRDIPYFSVSVTF